MRTDNDVDGTVFQAFEHLFRLLRSTGTRQVFYLDGKVFQATSEGLEMLISQNGSRHKNCDLFVVHACLESSPDCHFRLAETNVATDKPVHRPLTFHIGFDVLGGFELVGRIFIEETCLELMLHEAVVAEGKSFFFSTTRVEQDEVASDVLNLLLRPFLHAFPSTSTKAADARRLTFTTFVFRDFMQGMDGDIDVVVS